MTITTKQLEYILDNTPASQNIMLVGKHGIGKSRILEDYFSKKGAKVVTLFLGQMSDPGDLIGLPEKNEKTGKTDFMLPYWFPLDNEPVVLFLDELNRARPEVLQTIMDLTLNRKLAGKSLPAGSRIISAVNNGNEYQLTDLDPALVSRFNIYEFAPSVEDWIKWAGEAGIDSRIIDFISENPEYLDSDSDSEASDNLERTPDRRSWERTSQIIKNIPLLTDLQKPIISGILGNKATSLFFKFVMEKNIPSASYILTGRYTDLHTTITSLSIPDLTRLNESLFKYIEASAAAFDQTASTFDQTSSTFDQAACASLAANFEKYFDCLGAAGLKEMQSQLVSLCNAERYPNTLVFISTKAVGLYKKMLELVK